MTSDVAAALRDADVVMALRIQRERMASGLLPSLREYAARYGLTAARLATAAPGALVMHPGPMNEGVEIAADVAAGAQSVITDQVTNGVAIRMALLYLLAGVDARRAARDRPRHRRAPGWWIPASGREGPGEIVVRDGILEAVTWLDGADADGHRRDRRRRRARVHRPARPPARARQRGCRDGRDRAGGGRARRVHDGLRDAEHDPGARRARRAVADPCRGRGLRLAGRAARPRRRDGRAGRGDAGGARRARRRGRRRVLRRRLAGPVGGAAAQRARLRRGARACRSSTTPRTPA